MHLQNLNQFDTWNSFISHIVVYREVQYRSDFFYTSKPLPTESYALRNIVLLIRLNLMCLQKLWQFDCWNSFITHIVVYTKEQYRFNIFDISNPNSHGKLCIAGLMFC